MRSRKLQAILVALTLVVCLPFQPAQAATKGDITISPAFQNISLDPSKPGYSFTLSVTNHTALSQAYKISAVDFGSLDETGGVFFVGLSKTVTDYQYGLASWMGFDQDSVAVAPGQTANVQVSIKNEESLSPGGHYAAVLIAPEQDAATGSNKIALNEVAASLVFLNKQGGDIYKLELNRTDLHTTYLQLPESIMLRFQNAGNVHVVPRGLVTVTGPFGTEVARGVINEQSGIMLPASFRRFTLQLRKEGWLQWPGRYKVLIQYRYDGQANFQTASRTLVVWNAPFLLIALLITVLLALLLTRWRRKAGRLVGSVKRRVRNPVHKAVKH